MTDKPQELDEILDGFARAVRVVVVNGLSHDKYERRQKDFKQAILDWHNKQVLAELGDSLHNDNLDEAAYSDIEHRYDKYFDKLKESSDDGNG